MKKRIRTKTESDLAYNREWKRANPDKCLEYARRAKAKIRVRFGTAKVFSSSSPRVINRSGNLRPKINKRDGLLMVVYAIKAGNFVKIGIAENITTRLIVFRTHCPMPVSLEFCSQRVLRPAARNIELDCHAYFWANHSHGEWFEVDSCQVVDYLKSITESAANEPHPVQLRLVA